MATPESWDAECARFHAALAAFDAYLASDAELKAPAERLFQGPIADALTMSSAFSRIAPHMPALSGGCRFGSQRRCDTTRSVPVTKSAAAAAIGIHRVEFLGYRDSGMAGEDTNAHPDCFAAADLEEAATRLAAILTEESTDVLTVYDEHGGYGHPDHIQAHRITHAAVAAAAGAGWRVSKVYSCARVLEVEQEDRDRLAALGGQAPFRAGDDDFFWAVPQWAVTTAIDAEAWVEQKSAALCAHATQVSVADQWYALSDGVGAALRGTEWFTCETGLPQRVEGELETDLFAGVEL